MAKMRKPGWNACEELSKIKNNSGIKCKEATVENEKGNGEPRMHPPRMKTLTRATRNEIPAVKAQIKSMLPLLQQTEVRRYKIPHYESIILELEEANLKEAAEYIRKLLQLDENFRKQSDIRTEILEKPLLKNQSDLLDTLRDGLTISNRAKQKREVITEAVAFLEVALAFQSKTSEWWWIAEELYKSALEVGSKIKIDDGQTLTILHYLYGRFLQNEMNESKRALTHLNEAWRNSRNKNWNASKILGIKQKSVFRETCMLLHKAFLYLAKQLKNKDPNKAVKACIQALEKAQDSDCDEYVADTFYELGKCQRSAGNTEEALKNFSKYLALVKRLQNHVGICNAHMQLAFSYKEIKDEENIMKHFRLLKESAAEFQLLDKLADSHYYIGEHLLNRDQPGLATPNLEYAVSLYRNLNAIEECDRARCLAGVSKGQEIMESYVKLIIDSGKKDSDAILKLCKWKNSRVPFWLDKKTHKESFEEDSLCEMENRDSTVSMGTFSSLSLTSEKASKIKSQEEEAGTGSQKNETRSLEETENAEKIIRE